MPGFQSGPRRHPVELQPDADSAVGEQYRAEQRYGQRDGERQSARSAVQDEGEKGEHEARRDRQVLSPFR
jgi:hypothetical protein